MRVLPFGGLFHRQNDLCVNASVFGLDLNPLQTVFALRRSLCGPRQVQEGESMVKPNHSWVAQRVFSLLTRQLLVQIDEDRPIHSIDDFGER